MKVFYFSATGNSLHVAGSLGGETVSVSRCLRSGNLTFEDDVAGFVFPVHFGHIPPPMLSFMERVQLQAGYVFVVSTYGHVPGNVNHAAVSMLRRRGLPAIYSCSLPMVDNYLPSYAVEDEIALLPKKHVTERLAAIVNDIKAHRMRPTPQNLLSAAVSLAERLINYKNVCRKFLITEACNSCGTCAKVCSQHNVSVMSGRQPVFGLDCISCMACINLCPQCAIHLKKERSAMRWRHPAIRLEQLFQ